MPKVKPLTDTQIKALKSKEKTYKIADGNGLYLYVTPSGILTWRARYTINGTAKDYKIGRYPSISLKNAREQNMSIREYAEQGIDISMTSLTNDKSLSFKGFMNEYTNNRTDLSPKYIKNMMSYMERDWFPYIGDMKVSDITVSNIKTLLKKTEARGVKTVARKVKKFLSRAFRYAVTMEYIKSNPADIDVEVLLKPHTPKNYSHTTDPKILKEYFLAVEASYCDIVTKTALLLAPYVFLRPANIQMAEWGEFDFKNKIWSIDGEKMKMKKDHLVPLTDSVIKILMPILNNGSKYLFPSPQSRTRPISNNTLNIAIKRIGFKDVQTMHGFRHSASSLLHENIHIHGVQSDVIEIQLAHVEKNAIKSTYNKAIYLSERTRLMQWWSDYLDDLRK